MYNGESNLGEINQNLDQDFAVFLIKEGIADVFVR